LSDAAGFKGVTRSYPTFFLEEPPFVEGIGGFFYRLFSPNENNE